jgi:hypothetical protein
VKLSGHYQHIFFFAAYEHCDLVESDTGRDFNGDMVGESVGFDSRKTHDTVLELRNARVFEKLDDLHATFTSVAFDYGPSDLRKGRPRVRVGGRGGSVPISKRRTSRVVVSCAQSTIPP